MLYALIACEWVQVAASMLLFGGSAMRELLRRQDFGWDGGRDDRLFRILRPAAAAALISAAGWLLLEGASMSGVWGDAVSPAVIRTVLTETEFGHLWMARLGIAAAVWLIAAFSRRPSPVLALAAAALLGSLALTGHAVMNTGALGWAHPLNQAVHLFAAGLWLGGLLPLAVLLAGAARRTDRAPIVRALRRFSDVTLVAVALVLGSGLFNAWMLVGRPAALFDSVYGRTLTAKLVLVAVLVSFALANRVRLLPRLAAGGGAAAARIKRNVKLEILLGAAVVAAAVVLGNLPPPAMMP